MESVFLRNFEKFLRNPVTFWADLRLSILGAAVIGRSYGAVLVSAESEAAAGKAGQAEARFEGNQPWAPARRKRWQANNFKN